MATLLQEPPRKDFGCPELCNVSGEPLRSSIHPFRLRYLGPTGGTLPGELDHVCGCRVAIGGIQCCFVHWRTVHGYVWVRDRGWVGVTRLPRCQVFSPLINFVFFALQLDLDFHFVKAAPRYSSLSSPILLTYVFSTIAGLINL